MKLLARIRYFLYTPSHMKWFDKAKAELKQVDVVRGTDFGGKGGT